ncbi:hypothetical protein [Chryseobacterium defluvii]|uniref:Lipoprotein n=1 Tax=Chryseobacterium defluvii TaxID=160396 RepID=A0A495SEP4_9FLAO|nr:hypothetical protein [Chryseobacterium defluvii]RKS98089.1 hypothetical protein BCF58_2227 [Chryseobacterium defluvii]
MRTLFIIAGLLSFFSCKKESGSIKDKNFRHTDSIITDTITIDSPKSLSPIESIRKKYAVLNNLLTTKKLDSVKFEYSCNNERSGKVVFYSDQEGIKVIQHSYAEYSHFSSIENYYIENNEPFFIFREDTSWNFDGGTPEKPIIKDNISEQRIYLQHGKAIKCLEKKYTKRSNTPHNPDPQKIASKEINCSAEELLKAYELLIRNSEKRGEIQCL